MLPFPSFAWARYFLTRLRRRIPRTAVGGRRSLSDFQCLQCNTDPSAPWDDNETRRQLGKRRNDNFECCKEQFFKCNYLSHPGIPCKPGSYHAVPARYRFHMFETLCRDLVLTPRNGDPLGLAGTYAMSAPLDGVPSYARPAPWNGWGDPPSNLYFCGRRRCWGNSIMYQRGRWYLLSGSFFKIFVGSRGVRGPVGGRAVAASDDQNLLGGWSSYYNGSTYLYDLSYAEQNSNQFGAVYCPGSDTIVTDAGGNQFYYGPPYFRLCNIHFYCPTPTIQLYCGDLTVYFQAAVPPFAQGSSYRFNLTYTIVNGFPTYVQITSSKTDSGLLQWDTGRGTWSYSTNLVAKADFSTGSDPKVGWAILVVALVSDQNGTVAILSSNVDCVNDLPGFGGVNVPQKPT